MSVEFILLLLIGRLFIMLGMIFPPFSESRFSFVRQVWKCDLCAGVYVFTFLSFVMKETILETYFYFPLIAELVTGCVASFLVHVFVIGWKSKFEVIEII